LGFFVDLSLSPDPGIGWNVLCLDFGYDWFTVFGLSLFITWGLWNEHEIRLDAEKH